MPDKATHDKVTVGDVARCLGVGGENDYMEYGQMVEFLMRHDGLSESEARRSIREDMFKGLLKRTEKGYRVNREYKIRLQAE